MKRLTDKVKKIGLTAVAFVAVLLICTIVVIARGIGKIRNVTTKSTQRSTTSCA